MAKGNRKSILVGLAVVVFAILSFTYWGNQKQVWFCDEIYTYQSANGFEQDWPADKRDVWQTGKDVEAFFAADWDTLSLNDISVRLYNDHVPLYFWIFRCISCWFFHGSGSIWIGLSMNLVFYLCVLVLVYKLILSLENSPWVSGAVTCLACIINRLLLEQATTLRMYMMLLAAELLLLWVEIRLIQKAKQNSKIWREMAALFVISLIGFLTHYDFWIYYAVTMTLSCLWLLYVAVREGKKRFLHTKAFRIVLVNAGCFVLALLSTVLLFPYCRWNLNKGKGQTALHSMFVFSKEKLGHIAWGYRRLSQCMFADLIPCWAGLLLIFGCILAGAYLMYHRKEKDKLVGYVLALLVAQAYQLLVCFTLPDAEEERYLWGSFTIMMLCAVCGGLLLLKECVKKLPSLQNRAWLKWTVAVVLVVCICMGEVAVIDNGNGITYMNYPGKDRKELEKAADIPWLVYGSTVGVYSYYDWIIPDRICFLSQESTDAGRDALSELEGEKSVILYVYQDYLDESVHLMEDVLGCKVEAEYWMQSTNLSVYRCNIISE